MLSSGSKVEEFGVPDTCGRSAGSNEKTTLSARRGFNPLGRQWKKTSPLRVNGVSRFVISV